jgi:hypothetical protein
MELKFNTETGDWEIFNGEQYVFDWGTLDELTSLYPGALLILPRGV